MGSSHCRICGFALTGLVVILTLTLGSGCSKQAPAQLKVKSLELVNDDGKVMATLATESNGVGADRTEAVALKLFAADGSERLTIGVGDLGSAIQLRGSSEQSQLNIMLGANDVIQFVSGDSVIVLGGDAGTITAFSREGGRAIQLSAAAEPQVRSMRGDVWETLLPKK